MTLSNKCSDSLFDVVEISDALLVSVKEEVQKYVPNFVRLLRNVWVDRMYIDEAIQRMFGKDYFDLLVSFPNIRVTQVEIDGVYIRIRRVWDYISISIASDKKWMQMGLCLVKEDENHLYTYRSSKLDTYIFKRDVGVENKCHPVISRKYVADDVAHREGLIKLKRRRINILELQQAALGGLTPPHILIEIEDLQREINDLKVEIEVILAGKFYT